MMMLLLLKICLAPMLVAAVTVAARRWGLRVGGVLTALPIVGGPTLCFYAIEQGNVFAASAAGATLLGIVGIAAFCIVYAHIAERAKWMTALIAGGLTFAVTAVILYRVRLGVVADLVVAITSLRIAQYLLPSPSGGKLGAGPSRWDLPLRMLAAATLVLVLTSLAERLGAQLSGILTAFPVATLVLAVFTHEQLGARSVASFFRGVLPGLQSFAVFCFMLSVALGPARQNLPVAVMAALGTQFILQALIIWKVSRRSTAAVQRTQNCQTGES